MGLSVMIVGLVLFLGVHTLTTQRKLRDRFVVSWGEAATRSPIRWHRPLASH